MMEKQVRKLIGKKMAKNMKMEVKCIPKGSQNPPKSRKMHPKIDAKNDWKKETTWFPQSSPGDPAELPRHPMFFEENNLYSREPTRKGQMKGGVQCRQERRAPKHSPVGRKRTRSGSKLPSANSRSGSLEGLGASGNLFSMEVLVAMSEADA